MPCDHFCDKINKASFFSLIKMAPSFPFCCDKRPGGTQGGSGMKRWPQEQVDSNSVGKIIQSFENKQIIPFH